MSLQTVLGERVASEREKWFLAAHAAGHDRIYRYFRRRTPDAATAEDLCAEVFRIAWEKSGGGGSLSVMVLFGVARNVLRNHERSLSRAEGLVRALRMERAPEVPGNETAVGEALNLLSTVDRDVLLLTYWDGLSSSEVSDLLNTTSSAVRMRLHRARKELSRALQAQVIAEGAEK